MATTKRIGRVGMLMPRLVLALTLALLLAGALAHHAGAAPVAMDKGAFKTGCESGGGSYIENPDGSFQCNLKSGGTIKCPDTTSQCTYTNRLVATGGIRPGKIGNIGSVQVVETAVPTKPTGSLTSGKLATAGFIAATATPTP